MCIVVDAIHVRIDHAASSKLLAAAAKRVDASSTSAASMYSCSDIAQTVHLLCTVQEANERGRGEWGRES